MPPYNGSGVFSPTSADNPVVPNTLIESTKFNNTITDIAAGLTTCITKDGQSVVSANIPFGGFKLTGIGAATARTDAASLATIQDGTGVYIATVGGTADVITLTASPAITSYVTGQKFSFIASGANTTNVTVAINGLTAKAITKNGSTALIAGDIPSGAMIEIEYDGTRFQLPNLSTTAGSENVGYLNIPQNSQSAAYPIVLTDSGKHLLHPTADNNARTFTIPANSSVAFPIGTAITFVNQINTLTIAITTDTLTLAGAGTTGSRSLAANGIATALKITSTGWLISGTGLT